MRIANDQFVNGVRPTGALEQRQCIELRTMGGQAWVQIALDEGESVPTEGQLIAEEGATPTTVALSSNPSGAWSTVPLAEDAQVSARPGFPRLVL
jgi:hypothetical protein